MEKFLKRTSDFIFSQQKTILSSALILSFMIILTSLFGFLRYRVLSTYFNKEELDIFFASFRLPDLIFEILITGAITSTFIPFYLKYKEDKKALTENVSSVINFILIFLFFFIILLFLFNRQIIIFITPGYNQEKTEKIIYFSKFLLLGQLPFFILGNFLTGLGQANKIFFLSALAPVLYNLTIIIFTIFFHNQLNLLAPIIGVILGSVVLFLIQTPLIFKLNFSYQPIIKKTKEVIDFFRLIIPRTLTVIVAQIDATIDLTLATFLGSGAYTSFYLAQHLQLLPVSIIGIAFGQASLPYLSEIYQQKKIEEYKKIVVDSILRIFFLIIPIAIFLIFARTPLVRFFFGGEKFDWQATVQTAITLSYFALSLPFHSIYYFLTRCFYSMMDSKTPFYIAFFSIMINIFLSLIFIFILKLSVSSLALSFSISIFFNSLLLFLFLNKKIANLDYLFISKETGKILFSSILSGLFSYFLMKLFDGLVFNTAFTINVFFLILTIFLIFIILYLFISWLINVKELYLLTKLLIKVKEYQKKFIEFYSHYE